MFVRAKTIKDKKYAYLVSNIWKKGKVRQITKKYLGRIIFVHPVSKENFIPTPLPFDGSIKDCMIVLIKNEFCSRGFISHNRQNAIVGDGVIINFSTRKILKEDKPVVLFCNDRYFYQGTLRDLLDFYRPESSEDVPGKRLAQLFSDAGISISQEDFVALYKKIYLDN